MVTRALYLLLAGFLLFAAGCGDARANFQLHGQSPLNANDQGESTPVDVRFYQLRSDAKFRSATVDSLWTDDKKILGDDLLGEPSTTTVYPTSPADAPVPFTVNLDANARFVGVLALYHKADADDHRMLIIPIEDAGKETLLFTGYAVTLRSAKDH